MKELFAHLPPAIRRQMAVRSGVAMIFFILFFAIWIGTGELSFALPCLILAVFLFVNTAMMFYNIINGNYVCIHGICTSIERTGIRKRVKYITIAPDGKSVMIPIRHKVPGLVQGCGVTVFMSDKTPVYERDGGYVIDSYYTLTLEEG